MLYSANIALSISYIQFAYNLRVIMNISIQMHIMLTNLMKFKTRMKMKRTKKMETKWEKWKKVVERTFFRWTDIQNGIIIILLCHCLNQFYVLRMVFYSRLNAESSLKEFAVTGYKRFQADGVYEFVSDVL